MAVLQQLVALLPPPELQSFHFTGKGAFGWFFGSQNTLCPQRLEFKQACRRNSGPFYLFSPYYVTVRMSQSSIIAAVEIGTSKVVVLAAEIVNGRSLNLIGMGEAATQGVRKGEIVDFKAASNCVHAALMQAERNAGVQIEQVYLAQTGSHAEGFFNTASVNISASDNRVHKADIARAIAEAKGKQLPAERVYLHHVRNHFELDGQPVANPEGLEGSKLQVGYWSVHVNEQKLRNCVHVINGFGLNVEDVILSSVASGSMVLSDMEKQAGALVLDIGAGTTDWALYQRGVVRKTGVIAVGGDHLTNDLSLGLRISVRHAEDLKRKQGKLLLDKEDRNQRVWLVGDQMIGDHPIQLQTIVQILHARMEELFQLVRKQAGELCTPEHLPVGVVLTGNGSKMTQSAELAAQVFGLPVRYGELSDWVHPNLREAGFATPLGLMYYALKGRQDDSMPPAPAQRAKPTLLHRVSRLFGG